VAASRRISRPVERAAQYVLNSVATISAPSSQAIGFFSFSLTLTYALIRTINWSQTCDACHLDHCTFSLAYVTEDGQGPR
jgi:hypothetical protein